MIHVLRQGITQNSNGIAVYASTIRVLWKNRPTGEFSVFSDCRKNMSNLAKTFFQSIKYVSLSLSLISSPSLFVFGALLLFFVHSFDSFPKTLLHRCERRKI